LQRFDVSLLFSSPILKFDRSLEIVVTLVLPTREAANADSRPAIKSLIRLTNRSDVKRARTTLRIPSAIAHIARHLILRDTQKSKKREIAGNNLNRTAAKSFFDLSFPSFSGQSSWKE